MIGESAVYRARWVLPISAPPIPEGAVRVDAQGRLEAVGAADRVSLKGASLVDLGGAAILPGLVNVHAHPELTILRGQLEADAFPEWIERLIEQKYEVLSPKSLQVSTWLGIAEAIAAGVTCLGAPDDAGFALEVMIEAGLRGRVYREVFGPAPEHAETARREIAQRIDRMRGLQTDLVDVGISPHSPYTVSDRLFGLLTEYAEAEALPVCVHAAESEAERQFVREGTGPFADRLRARGIEVSGRRVSPIAWLAEMGILRTRPLLVHCVRVDEDDVKRVAEAGASVAHCPISNAKFGHGVAPLLSFMEAGVSVGLGTDSVVSNNRVDILEEARFAALSQRNAELSAGLLSADELLRLATLEGARALQFADRIGSLEPGKDADFIAVDLDRPYTTPAGDPAAAVIHSARGSDVRLTVVRGRVLYCDGKFTTMDWPALAEELKRVIPGKQGW